MTRLSIWLLLIVVSIGLGAIGITAKADAACSGSSPLWTAATPNRQDVVDCIAAAFTGDTVKVPAGTALDWTTVVTLTKAITLQGAGIGQTKIGDGIVGTGPLLDITLVAGLNTRVTGFEFFDNGRTGNAAGGVIVVTGQSGGGTLDARRIIFDHNKLDHVNGFGFRAKVIYGVLTDNVLLASGNNTMVYVLNNVDPAWSDARWAAATNFGGENFLFIEHNTFAFDVRPNIYGCIDGQGGGRWVVRYNTFDYCYVTAHGTESAGRSRGGRAIEIYNNSFGHILAGGSITSFRSGVGLIHDNTATGTTATTAASDLSNERLLDDFTPFGIVDGRNPWDHNDAGNPIETHTATIGGALTVTDSGAAWTVNQWTGYVVRKTGPAPCNVPITATDAATDRFTATGHGLTTGDKISIVGMTSGTPVVEGTYTATVIDANIFTQGTNITGNGGGGFVSKVTNGGSIVANCASPIISNTATTITYAAAFNNSPSQDLTFSTGHTFEINKVTEVFDQPGRSGGTNYAGAALPVPANDGSVDPSYEWNNTGDAGANLDFNVRPAYSAQIVANTHYFNDTPKPGYTPYTYPHPLTTGAPVVPNKIRFAPRQNLRLQ